MSECAGLTCKNVVMDDITDFLEIRQGEDEGLAMAKSNGNDAGEATNIEVATAFPRYPKTTSDNSWSSRHLSAALTPATTSSGSDVI